MISVQNPVSQTLWLNGLDFEYEDPPEEDFENHDWMLNPTNFSPAEKVADVVISCKGDDVVAASIGSEFGQELLSSFDYVGMEVSFPDTGLSRALFNFTEEWYILPLIKGSGFSREDEITDLPMVLDPSILKEGSPVRKGQAHTDELDLSHKVQKIYTRAAWTSKYWITQSQHEIMKIIANVLFDFNSTKKSVLLFPSEKGCGGFPPFGNLITAQLMLWTVNRGKQKKTTLLIMDETTKVMSRKMPPSASMALNCLHIAAAGPEAWKRFHGIFSSMRAKGLTQVDVVKYKDMALNQSIPSDISALEIRIENNSMYNASVLAKLRDEGILMTAIDLHSQLRSWERIRAIKQPKHIGIVIKEQEVQHEEWLRGSLQNLSRLFGEGQDRSEECISRIPDWNGYESRTILHDYYDLHSKMIGSTTSAIIYDHEHGIYIKKEVENRCGASMKIRTKDFLPYGPYDKTSAWDLNRVYGALTIKSDIEEVKTFLEEIAISRRITTVPDGLVSDDLRIVNFLLDYAKDPEPNTDIWLVTNDTEQRFAAASVMKELGRPFKLHIQSVDNYHQSIWRQDSGIFEHRLAEDFVYKRQVKIPRSFAKILGTSAVKFLYDRPNILRSYKYLKNIGHAGAATEKPPKVNKASMEKLCRLIGKGIGSVSLEEMELHHKILFRSKILMAFSSTTHIVVKTI